MAKEAKTEREAKTDKVAKAEKEGKGKKVELKDLKAKKAPKGGYYRIRR